MQLLKTLRGILYDANTLDEIPIYDSTFATDGPDFFRLIKKVSSYSPTMFGWSEYVNNEAIDIFNDLLLDPADENIKSAIGNHVIHKYTNAPDGVTMDPIRVSVSIETIDGTQATMVAIHTNNGVYVNLRKHGEAIIPTWEGPYLPGERDRTTIATEVGEGGEPSTTSEDVLYIQKFGNSLVPKVRIAGVTQLMIPDNFMNSSVYDTQNLNTPLFTYLTDKLDELDASYANFVKHKANQLSLIHISAAEREFFNSKLTAEELTTTVNTGTTEVKELIKTQYAVETQINERTDEVDAQKTIIDAHIASPTHVTSAQVTAWNAKSAGDHTHKKTNAVEIDASKVVSGSFHPDRLPPEIKERVIEISALSVLANTAITDEDRRTRYHNGNILVISDPSGDYTKNVWYRVIDATKIGTPNYAQGILEFTNRIDLVRLLWRNVLNKPTTLAGYGIANELYSKTQVDSTIATKKAVADAQKTAIETGLGGTIAVTHATSATTDKVIVGYFNKRGPNRVAYDTLSDADKQEFHAGMGRGYTGRRATPNFYQEDIQAVSDIGTFCVWDKDGRLKEVYPAYAKNDKFAGIFGKPYYARDVDPIVVSFAQPVESSCLVHGYSGLTNSIQLMMFGIGKWPAGVGNDNYYGIICPRVTGSAEQAYLYGFTNQFYKSFKINASTDTMNMNTSDCVMPYYANIVNSVRGIRIITRGQYNDADNSYGCVLLDINSGGGLTNVATYKGIDAVVPRIIGVFPLLDNRIVIVSETGIAGSYAQTVWVCNHGSQIEEIIKNPSITSNTNIYKLQITSQPDKSLVKACAAYVENVGPVVGLTFATIDSSTTPEATIGSVVHSIIQIKDGGSNLSASTISCSYPGGTPLCGTLATGICVGLFDNRAFQNHVTAFIMKTTSVSEVYHLAPSIAEPTKLNTVGAPFSRTMTFDGVVANKVLVAVTRAEGLFFGYFLAMNSTTSVDSAYGNSQFAVSMNGTNWFTIDKPTTSIDSNAVMWCPSMAYNRDMGEVWFSALPNRGASSTDKFITIRFSIDNLWSNAIKKGIFNNIPGGFDSLISATTSALSKTTISGSDIVYGTIATGATATLAAFPIGTIGVGDKKSQESIKLDIAYNQSNHQLLFTGLTSAILADVSTQYYPMFYSYSANMNDRYKKALGLS